MTFGEFLFDRLGGIAARVLLALGAAGFLTVSGTAPGVTGLLLIVWAAASALALGWEYRRQSAYLKELSAILEGLDRKCLLWECAPKPPRPYERCLLSLLRRSGSDMIREVSDAQEAVRAYREYIEQWVHEIKAPITAGKLICQGVEGSLRRKLLRELEQIDAHVERALYYARLESPEKDFLIQKTDLAGLCQTAIQNHRSLLIAGGVRVETENLEKTVYTDGKWAAFLLGQLLQNAAKYRSDHPVVTLRASQEGHRVRLTLQDNGIGIPEHELPRVFDRGFTGSNGRSRGGATGMGLYLCRQVADALAICLDISSTLGEGTTVTLTFPGEDNLSKL